MIIDKIINFITNPIFILIFAYCIFQFIKIFDDISYAKKKAIVKYVFLGLIFVTNVFLLISSFFAINEWTKINLIQISAFLLFYLLWETLYLQPQKLKYLISLQNACAEKININEVFDIVKDETTYSDDDEKFNKVSNLKNRQIKIIKRDDNYCLWLKQYKIRFTPKKQLSSEELLFYAEQINMKFSYNLKDIFLVRFRDESLNEYWQQYDFAEDSKLHGFWKKILNHYKKHKTIYNSIIGIALIAYILFGALTGELPPFIYKK